MCGGCGGCGGVGGGEVGRALPPSWLKSKVMPFVCSVDVHWSRARIRVPSGRWWMAAGGPAADHHHQLSFR